MDEQRPIDANGVKESLLSFYPFVKEMTKTTHDNGEVLTAYEVADMIEDCVDNAPTIDPEILPAVRELRTELAKVTAERDAVYCLPVKPGDKVYQQNGVDVYELEVKKIIFDCGHIAFDESAIGSSIHLTEEAANAALAKSVKP